MARDDIELGVPVDVVVADAAYAGDDTSVRVPMRRAMHTFERKLHEVSREYHWTARKPGAMR